MFRVPIKLYLSGVQDAGAVNFRCPVTPWYRDFGVHCHWPFYTNCLTDDVLYCRPTCCNANHDATKLHVASQQGTESPDHIFRCLFKSAYGMPLHQRNECHIDVTVPWVCLTPMYHFWVSSDAGLFIFLAYVDARHAKFWHPSTVFWHHGRQDAH